MLARTSNRRLPRRSNRWRPDVRRGSQFAARLILVALLVALLGALLGGRFGQAAEATLSERIPVQGIDGTLLLTGSSTPSPETLATFVRQAGKRSARIVCVEVVGDSPASPPRSSSDVPWRLAEAWLEHGGAQWLVARVRAGDGLRPDFTAMLAGATGVWFEARDPVLLAQWLASDPVAVACRALRARGVVLGGSASFAHVVAEFTAIAEQGENNPVPFQPLAWLPGVALSTGRDDDTRLAAVLRDHPRLVGLKLHEDAALLVRQREILVLGAGQTDVRYAAVEGRRDPSHSLGPRQRTADLTALRRAAADRLGAPYPPAAVDAPKVERGTLVIIGGGGTPPGLMQRFVEWSGGKEACIVVLPISMPDPLPERDGAAEAFRRAGAKEVHLLTGRTPAEVDRRETWELLDRATGIWFGGGRQWRFVDAYEGTESLRKMRGVLARGGVIGGSSAGATIQGDYLARGHPLGPHIMMADGYERSFAFLPGTAIDQHFTQRKRSADMLELMARYPQFLGIGIDETTALVVRGSVGEVIGKNHVHVFDTRRKDGDGRPHQETLVDGARYELVERRVMEK